MPSDKTHGNSSRRAVVLFAKKPSPGAVKTRLIPPLTSEDAARLYECMLHDTMTTLKTLSGITPFICYQDDAGAESYFSEASPDTPLFPQRGRDLGQRMQQAFTELFSRGFREVAIIGSDSPDLPPEIVHEAFTALEDPQTELVFGPAEDGGYYLVAMKSLWPELFTGIGWSSATVLQESLEIARDSFLGTALLPKWYDIDLPEDLHRWELLDENCRAVRTRNFLLDRQDQLRVSTL